jgi:hypothetical protein
MSKKRRMKPDEPDLQVAIQYVLKLEDGPRGGYHAGIDIEGEESLVALMREHEFLFRPLSRIRTGVPSTSRSGRLCRRTCRSASESSIAWQTAASTGWLTTR